MEIRVHAHQVISAVPTSAWGWHCLVAVHAIAQLPMEPCMRRQVSKGRPVTIKAC